MKLIAFPVAGGGGRTVHVNPEQVVCLMDMGEGRCQIVTTGLAGESSMSIIVSLGPDAVARRLAAEA